MNGKKAKRIRRSVKEIQKREDLSDEVKEDLINSLKEIKRRPTHVKTHQGTTALQDARKDRKLLVKRPEGMSKDKYHAQLKKQKETLKLAKKKGKYGLLMKAKEQADKKLREEKEKMRKEHLAKYKKEVEQKITEEKKESVIIVDTQGNKIN